MGLALGGSGARIETGVERALSDQGLASGVAGDLLGASDAALVEGYVLGVVLFKLVADIEHGA
jgi:hypothetical protein